MLDRAMCQSCQIIEECHARFCVGVGLDMFSIGKLLASDQGTSNCVQFINESVTINSA